jgi:hypothetical protein
MDQQSCSRGEHAAFVLGNHHDIIHPCQPPLPSLTRSAARQTV